VLGIPFEIKIVYFKKSMMQLKQKSMPALQNLFLLLLGKEQKKTD
jgi:hypothetical protein